MYLETNVIVQMLMDDMDWQVVMESHVTNGVVIIKMKFAGVKAPIQYIPHIVLRKLLPIQRILTLLLNVKKKQ